MIFWVICKRVFENIDISLSVLEREEKLSTIRDRLQERPEIMIQTMNIDEIKDLIQRQLSFDYDIKYINEKNSEYELIVQRPRKMYGFIIVLPKNDIWRPILKGILFDDKINSLLSSIENTRSYPSIPIQYSINNVNIPFTKH